MGKPGIFGVVLGVFLLFSLASSVRGDTVREPRGLQKLTEIQDQSLRLPDIFRDETGYLFAEHFADNNGKHLGFSVAAFHGGLRFGLVAPRAPVSVTQNPEPTAMVLLGTGLAAGAALVRRRRRKHRP